MMLPAALIFDVDGTLAETEEAHRQAFNETFSDFGLPWTWDQALYRDLLEVAGGKERLAHYCDAHAPPGAAEARARLGELHAAKTAHYTRLIEGGTVPLRPGVARLIREAGRHGVRLAIATTTSLVNVEALLRATLGEDGPARFEVIAAGDVVARKKPAPDIYHYVLGRLDLLPDWCVAFEDSRQGLLAASGAGLPTVVTPSVYTDHQDFPEALAVVSDLGEPLDPYTHRRGAGRADGQVSVGSLRRWLAER